MKILIRYAVAIFLIDQALKWLIVFGMGLRERGEIDVWPPYLVFRMAWNRGINFGLLQGEQDLARWGLILVAVAISAWVVIWARREADNKMVQRSAGILVGGAAGNVVDRVIHGAVADFLNVSCCGFDNPYAFNVADIAIFAGAFGLILWSGRAKTP